MLFEDFDLDPRPLDPVETFPVRPEETKSTDDTDGDERVTAPRHESSTQTPPSQGRASEPSLVETSKPLRKAVEHPPRKYRCPVCDARFRYKGELTRHSPAHGPFRCDQCDRSFKVDGYLMRHRVAMHSVPSSRNLPLTARCLEVVEETGRPPA